MSISVTVKHFKHFC